MIAMAMIALFAAAAPTQEGFEEIDNQEVEVVIYEDSESEDVVVNEEEEYYEEGEYSDEVVFEDESELSEDMVVCEDEE